MTARQERSHIVWFYLSEMSRMVKSTGQKTHQWLPKTAEGRQQNGKGPLRNKGSSQGEHRWHWNLMVTAQAVSHCALWVNANISTKLSDQLTNPPGNFVIRSHLFITILIRLLPDRDDIPWGHTCVLSGVTASGPQTMLRKHPTPPHPAATAES